MSLEIARVQAWEALDSRGRPTVGCDVTLAGGAAASVTVPSGASTGRHEAHELRDGGERYGGLGVRAAVRHIEERIAPAVVGRTAAPSAELDAAMLALDDAPNLRTIGANAVLAVSLAAALAAAREMDVPLFRWLAEGGAGDVPAQPLLPLPMVNILSGGAHAGGLVDLQDVLFVPVGASCVAEAMEWTVAVRAAAARRLERAGFSAALVADEGGLAAPLPSNRAAIELVGAAIEDAGLQPGGQGAIALDIAATQLLRDGRYLLHSEQRELTGAELVEEIAGWCRELPIVSVEDPVAEDDEEGWDAARAALGRVQVLGDDLFATNADRLLRGIERGWANAILIKVNQNGTLSGTCDVLRRARAAGMATVVSARSGETEDSWLADLAVGTRAGQIKVGSTMRSERTAKWNRLLRIEAVLAPELAFAGRAALERSPYSPNPALDEEKEAAL